MDQFLSSAWHVISTFSVCQNTCIMNFDNFLCLALVFSQTAFIVALVCGLFSIKSTAKQQHTVITEYVPVSNLEPPFRNRRSSFSGRQRRTRRRNADTNISSGLPSYHDLIGHINNDN